MSIYPFNTSKAPSKAYPKLLSYYSLNNICVVLCSSAMAIAKGLRRTYDDTMIKKTALLAAQAKHIPEALSAVGVGVYNDYQRYQSCVKKGQSPSVCKQIAKRTGIIEQVGTMDILFDIYCGIY